MDRVRNLTPHDVVVVTDDGPVTFPPEDQPARLDVTTTACGVIETDGGPLHLVEMAAGDPIGLPDPEPGTWLIVSSPLAIHLVGREDVVVPTGLVRAADGSIEACRALGRYRSHGGSPS